MSSALRLLHVVVVVVVNNIIIVVVVLQILHIHEINYDVEFKSNTKLYACEWCMERKEGNGGWKEVQTWLVSQMSYHKN